MLTKANFPMDMNEMIRKNNKTTQRYFMQRIPIEARDLLIRKSIKMTEFVKEMTGKKKIKPLPLTRVILALAKSEVYLENETLLDLKKGRKL